MFKTSLGMWRQGAEILHRRAQIRQNCSQAEQGGGTSGSSAPATRGTGGIPSLSFVPLALIMGWTVRLHVGPFNPELLLKVRGGGETNLGGQEYALPL